MRIYEGRFPLFLLFMQLCRFSGMGYAFFQFLINLIVTICIAYTIWKYSENKILSATLFVGSGILNVYYISGLRQMICMAVFFFAFYEFLLKKKYFTYYALMIPCFFIHNVTMFCLLLPILFSLMKRIWNRKSCPIIIVISAAAYCFMNIFGNAVSAYLPSYWGNFLKNISQNSVSIVGIGQEVLLLLIVLLLYRNADSSVQKSESVRFQIVICIAAFVLYAVFVRLPIMSRAADFLQIIHLILIPQLLMHQKGKNKKSILLAAVLVVNLFLCYVDLTDGTKQLYNRNLWKYPYISIFDINSVGNYYKLEGNVLR